MLAFEAKQRILDAAKLDILHKILAQNLLKMLIICHKIPRSKIRTFSELFKVYGIIVVFSPFCCYTDAVWSKLKTAMKQNHY